MTAVQDPATPRRAYTPVETRRRTKIVCTIGPATDTPDLLDGLIGAGMDSARLNCSHGESDDLRRRTRMVREAAERMGRPIALLFDLQGPKIRLSGDTVERTLAVGDAVRFTSSADATGEPDELVVAFDGFTALLTERSQIVVGDGTPRFVVVQRGATEVLATATAAGRVSPRKGVNVTHAQPTLPALTVKDLADIEIAVECEADFVALSFIRTADDIAQLRERLVALGSDARLIAKIEKVEAFEALDEIIEASDGVMVARGDYGVEAGLARVPLMQKDTIHRATQAGKLVITATQMLESMITSPEPTRAEATDVANAVIDGTSAVMLSAETGVGRYPDRGRSEHGRVRRGGGGGRGDLPRAARPAPVGPRFRRRGGHVRRRHPRRRRRGLGPDHPHLHGRHAACLLEVPAAPADHRPRPQGARGQPARARVGGLPAPHVHDGVHRRARGDLGGGGEGDRQPALRVARGGHRGPLHGPGRGHQPHHRARRAVSRTGQRGRGDAERGALEHAKARLDTLDLYPVPVRLDRVRMLTTPWLFRVPGMRRFDGYELGPLILLRRPPAATSDDLVVHELCHVWQSQHRHVRMWLSYLYRGYRRNPHEVEARRAASETASGDASRERTGATTRS